MKYRDLERILRDHGYNLIRNGGHKIFSNGIKNVAIPHSNSINKILTKHILKEIGANNVRR